MKTFKILLEHLYDVFGMVLVILVARYFNTVELFSWDFLISCALFGVGLIIIKHSTVKTERKKNKDAFMREVEPKFKLYEEVVGFEKKGEDIVYGDQIFFITKIDVVLYENGNHGYRYVVAREGSCLISSCEDCLISKKNL